MKNFITERKPGIIAVVDSFLPAVSLKEIYDKGADVLELRIDCFSGDFALVLDYVQQIRVDLPKIPLLCTIRETEENRDQRLTMFKKILPFVDAVDIEIDSTIGKEVAALAADKIKIVSEHNYDITPENKDLTAIVNKSRVFDADIVKLAVTAQSQDDVIRLLNFTHEQEVPMITISMGEIGKISRLVAPLYGSLFSYAFINGEVAPGQLSVEVLDEEMNRYFSDTRKIDE